MLALLDSKRYNGYMNQCLWCQKDTNNPKFCSLSCGAKHQAANTPKASKIAWCEECNKSFKSSKGKRFCSRSCSVRVNNKLRNRGNWKQNNFCICGKSISHYSKKCHGCDGKDKNKARVSEWLDGTWDGTVKHGLSKIIKVYLIQEAKYKCTLCGWDKINPVTGRCPLEIDHIDGDAYNNHKDNLQVVCPNCHSLTPTYRALNKNGKRKYRK